MNARVHAVCAHPSHAFSKPVREAITLLAGQGVDGDAHCGSTVRHRSRVARDPTQPNLRQVHLVHRALFAELEVAGFAIAPGSLGENITTEDIDLLALPSGTLLYIGECAVLRVTGLRNPCAQIDAFKPGLMAAVLGRSADGRLIRKAGVMSVVMQGGIVRPGDAIDIEWPRGRPRALEPV